MLPGNKMLSFGHLPLPAFEQNNYFLRGVKIVEDSFEQSVKMSRKEGRKQVDTGVFSQYNMTQ